MSWFFLSIKSKEVTKIVNTLIQKLRKFYSGITFHQYLENQGRNEEFKTMPFKPNKNRKKTNLKNLRLLSHQKYMQNISGFTDEDVIYWK